MDARLDSAAEQAAGLRQEALATLLGHDADAARGRRADWRPLLVARNAAARPRGGVAEVELLTFVADEAVGPGSGAGGAPARWAPRWQVDGGRVLVQALAERLARDRLESPRHYPDNDLVRRTRAVAWLPEVPALGVATFGLGERADEAPRQPPAVVRAAAGVLDNGELSLRVGDDGRVALRAAGGRELPDLLAFESCGDVGDTYTPSLVGPLSRPRFLGARLVAAGPLRGTLELRYVLRLPARRTRDAVAARRARVRLRVRLSLDAGAPFLRVAVRGVNEARDHRLRIVLRTGVAGAEVYADAAFGPVHRRPLAVPPGDARLEQPPPTAPLHRYVSLDGAGAGATVYADGLAEYEASADGAVAVTLLRAVGALSRSDLPERTGHAGWPVETPGAQCRGAFAARLALLPHGPRDDATVALVDRVADDVLLPLRATTLRSALHGPGSVPGVELHGDGLALSAVKPDEAGEGLVLRCVNLLDQPVPGTWHLPRAPRRVDLARLDETPLQPMDVHGREVPFVAGPREIVTLLVR
jgi:hypothetical protein